MAPRAHHPRQRKVFGVHERTIRRWRDGVEDLLLAHGFQPAGAPEPIRTVEDLVAYVEAVGVERVAVDGTEIRRNSPVDYQAQKAAYSGKTKDHVVKASVVADSGRRPLWFAANPSGEGRTHDVTMLRAQTELLATLAMLTAAGVGSWATRPTRASTRTSDCSPSPATSSPEGENDPWRTGSTTGSWVLSSMRMPVEHAIGRLKWWTAMRYWRRPADRFDRGGRAIAILTSLL